MNVPNYVNAPIADESRNLTVEWSNVLQQLLTELKLNAGAEGFKPSPLTTQQIADLVAIANTPPVEENKAVSNGSIYFDTTLNNADSFKAIVDGVLYKFNLTAI